VARAARRNRRAAAGARRHARAAPRRARCEPARAAGAPFVSFFGPDEMLALAREAGFRDARGVSSEDLAQRYFAARTDGLRPASGETFLLART